MGIELVIPSAIRIAEKIVDTKREQAQKIAEIRHLYGAEIKRWRALLKVAVANEKECNEGSSITVDPNSESLEIEGE